MNTPSQKARPFLMPFWNLYSPLLLGSLSLLLGMGSLPTQVRISLLGQTQTFLLSSTKNVFSSLFHLSPRSCIFILYYVILLFPIKFILLWSIFLLWLYLKLLDKYSVLDFSGSPPGLAHHIMRQPWTGSWCMLIYGLKDT